MVEDFVTQQLEMKTFDEVLEEFDLTPQDVFVMLYNNGLIDEELLTNLSDCI